jgi:hypothetical protein
MTSARRQRKARSAGVSLVGIAVAVAFAVAVLPPGREVGAALTEQVVTSPQTGLAIDGIDPVAYFTDSQPLAGRPEFEYRHLGVIWRFRNDGNKVAFARSPEIYTPRYGGYDPVAVARGVAVAGNPLLWIVNGQRLYLFYSDAARAQFVANPEKIIADAEARWPAVSATLTQ